MSKLGDLKRIVEDIRDNEHIRSSISNYETTRNINQQIILDLLTLAHNLLKSDYLARQSQNNVYVLQNLSAIISHKTCFPQSVKILASLDKIKFLQYCQNNRDMHIMTKKVFGLYPLMEVTSKQSKLLKFEIENVQQIEDQVLKVGNVNWLLTRQIISKWYQKTSDETNIQVKLSTCILLGRQQLIKLCQQNPWNKLWCFLYLYLNKLFLSNYVNSSKASWSTRQNSFYEQSIMKTRDFFQSLQQKVIFNLLAFILYEFIKKNHENEYYQFVVQNFKEITIESYQEKHKYLLSLQIMNKISHKLKQETLVQKCSNFMHIAKGKIKAIPQSDYSPELQYYIPHIYDQIQVFEYFTKSKDDFWNYSLKKPIANKLAQYYLTSIQQFQPQKLIKIFQNHNNLLQGIFNCDQKLLNKKIGLKIMKTCQQNNEIIYKILTQESRYLNYLIKYDEFQSIISQWVQQWRLYYILQLNQFYDSEEISSAFKFLNFQYYKISQNIRKYFFFPQNQSNNFYSMIITRLINTISEQQNNGDAIFNNTNIMNNVRRLRQNQADKVWYCLSELMIRNQSLLVELIEIDQQNGEEKQISLLSEPGLYDTKMQ